MGPAARVGCAVLLVALDLGALALRARTPHGATSIVTKVPVALPPVSSASTRPSPSGDEEDLEPATLAAQRERLFTRMREELALTPDELERVRSVFAASPILGQGNPAVSKHPMTRSECRRVRSEAGVQPARVAACGAPGMVPLYDTEKHEGPADARVCIDQLEFPNIPCEYPVVQVRASEAALLCQATGKRLCDAHEWEGACAGSLRPPDREYRWGWPRTEQSQTHNVLRERVWAYGPTKNHALCATGSEVTPGCEGGGFATCGSNTYPTGAFPACRSPFGVFDQHGNAAEHMSVPTRPEELGSRGGEGFTEMKGSWFAFIKANVYADDCRYRAPDWHDTRVSNEKSHRNYHLGFRCCKDVGL